LFKAFLANMLVLTKGMVMTRGVALRVIVGVVFCLTGSVVAEASTLDLGGSAMSTRIGFYGSAVYQNNVVNSAGSPSTGSVLTDPTGPNIGANTPWLAGASPSSTLANYSVNWFYAGSESGYNITFDATGLNGGTGPYTEHNANYNCYGCGAHPLSPVFMGTTENSLAFSLSWKSGSVKSQTPGNNLIFAYLRPDSTGTHFTLSKDPSDWFVFALNDSGSPDSDYDDFVGFAQVVVPHGPGPGQTPLPAALPLMGTGLLAGGIMLKKRRRAAAQHSA